MVDHKRIQLTIAQKIIVKQDAFSQSKWLDWIQSLWSIIGLFN